MPRPAAPLTRRPPTSAGTSAAGGAVMGGWQSAAPQHGNLTEPLMPFDATRPNIARAYDYLLGGKDNFAADRDLAEKLVAIYPGIRQMVADNRRFLARALDYMLAQGIRQYVDLGAGLPTAPAVHEIVRATTAPPPWCTWTTTRW